MVRDKSNQVGIVQLNLRHMDYISDYLSPLLNLNNILDTY